VSNIKNNSLKDLNSYNKSNKQLNAYSLAGIGIGGIIGSGFFLGSGIAIREAGPSIALAFFLGGIIMSQVLGAMTSISINRPVTGSYRVYTEQFLGKFAGYLLGWVIYISGILGTASEAIAAAIFLKYWFPNLSVALLAFCMVSLVILINMLQMKYFSYLESSMAVINILVLVVFLVIGITYLFSHGIQVKPFPFATIKNFFPNNISGLVKSMLIVVFTYSGISTIAMATSDVANPSVSIPKATVIVTLGVVSLYTLIMLVIVLTVNWNFINTNSSPLIQSLNGMNINWASDAINAIILIATTSVMIGSYYKCNKMLISLSEAREAPSVFQNKTRKNFYLNAWILTGITTLLVVLLSYFLNATLFSYLLSACSYFSFFNWIINLIVYIIWLKKRSIEEAYTSPLIWGSKGAYGTIIVILILFFMSLQVHDFRIGFYSAAVITILIGMSYKLKTISK